MAYEVKKLFYATAVIANKAGEGAKVLRAFSDAGVNFLGVNGYPKGKTLSAKKTTLDLVPENFGAFAKVAKKLGVELSGKLPCISVAGEDAPGAAAAMLEKLGSKGINVIAMHAVSAGAGRGGGMLFVAAADVAKTMRLLRK